MKLSQEPAKFMPITLVLETKAEAVALLSLAKRYSDIEIDKNLSVPGRHKVIFSRAIALSLEALNIRDQQE